MAVPHPPADPTADIAADVSVYSDGQMKRLERQNTINALRRCRWKIYGKDGAAGLLDIKPTTLIERMKRMGIQKPATQPRPNGGAGSQVR